MGIGDTVHLVISLSNLGPKSCDAKLNYKIPVGLKLLSSQGPGAYDVASGVWDAGLLLVNDSVSLDLVLQVLGAGCFNHVVDVYDNLNISNNHMVWSMVCASLLGNVTPTVINSSAFDGLKPIDNGNGGSGSGNGGSGNGGNGGNGGGSGGAGGSGNGGKGGGNGGGDNQKPDEKPKPGINKGNDQLYRDQMYVRDYVGYVGSNNHDGSDDQGDTHDGQDDNQNDDRDNPNKPPQMPGWEIDTSILDDIVMATSIISSGLIFYTLANREFGGLGQKLADNLGGNTIKNTLKDLFKKYNIKNEAYILLPAAYVATLLSPPDLGESILLAYDIIALAMISEIIVTASNTNVYTFFSLVLLFISFGLLLKKLGTNPGDILKESVIGQFIEFLKNFFK